MRKRAIHPTPRYFYPFSLIPIFSTHRSPLHLLPACQGRPSSSRSIFFVSKDSYLLISPRIPPFFLFEFISGVTRTEAIGRRREQPSPLRFFYSTKARLLSQESLLPRDVASPRISRIVFLFASLSSGHYFLYARSFVINASFMRIKEDKSIESAGK